MRWFRIIVDTQNHNSNSKCRFSVQKLIFVRIRGSATKSDFLWPASYRLWFLNSNCSLIEDIACAHSFHWVRRRPKKTMRRLWRRQKSKKTTGKTVVANFTLISTSFSFSVYFLRAMWWVAGMLRTLATIKTEICTCFNAICHAKFHTRITFASLREVPYVCVCVCCASKMKF